MANESEQISIFVVGLGSLQCRGSGPGKREPHTTWGPQFGQSKEPEVGGILREVGGKRQLAYVQMISS